MKSGRPRKIQQNLINQTSLSSHKPTFEISYFRSVLAEVGESDPSKWSLKKEWVDFHKKYFKVSCAKLTHARACYGFFRRHKPELTNFPRDSPIRHEDLLDSSSNDPIADSSFSSPSSSSSDVVPPLQKSIVFPKLEKIENSIVIINSRTDNFEIDKISNVLTIKTQTKISILLQKYYKDSRSM